MSDSPVIRNLVLTAVDTTGIQDYVFGSNRLRENSGASYLVEQATHNWVYAALERAGKHNVNLATGSINSKLTIEGDDLAGELIYAGGGNALLMFRSLDRAKSFAWELSNRVLRDAAGLELVIAHSGPFDWNPAGADLASRFHSLWKKRVSDKKRTLASKFTPLLGLSVTAECASTGLVATSRVTDPEERIVSREVATKSKANENAKRRLGQKFFSKVDPGQEYFISDELDHLGRIGGEESYIAVVHVDGNEMGKLIEQCGAGASTNRDYLSRLRRLSEDIDAASTDAILETLRILKGRMGPDKLGDPMDRVITEAVPKLANPSDEVSPRRIPLYRHRDTTEDKPVWPFRPMIFGGDDVTFVCNGQLGLSLAVAYMKAFTKRTAGLSCGPIHTGAGVCLVKSHYPFRRAYEMSAALTAEAKRELQDQKRTASAIDWHISTTGLGGDLGSIREREYQAKEGSLLMRPVWLGGDGQWRTWENFDRFVAHFNYDRNLAGRRNKLKSLRQVLRAGPEAVEEFLKMNKSASGDGDGSDASFLPKVKNDPGGRFHSTGWGDGRCVYFDALEAMDHHFFLEELSDGDD